MQALIELPAEIVRTSPEDLAPHLTDWRGAKTGEAMALLLPRHTDDVVEIVKWAGRHQVALVPQGGNTGLVGGSVPERASERPSVIISTRRLNAIEAIDPAGLSLVAGSGAILSAVHAAAEEVGCRFPLSLGAKGSATIGGLVSTNAGGVQVLRFGAMRSLVLGIEAVMPDGTILDQLSALRKDNTGYDIKQLLIGAEGTLGIITRVALKLSPQPALQSVAWAGVASAEAALDLLGRVRAAAGEVVESFELMAGEAVDLVACYYPDSRAPIHGDHAFHILIDVASAPEPLEMVLAKAMEDGVVADAALATSVAQAENMWSIRETIPMAEKQRGKAIKNDISVAVADLPAFHNAAIAMLSEEFPGARPFVFGHLGDGNLHWNIQAPVDAPEGWFDTVGEAARCRLHDIIHAHKGSISAEHGIGTLKAAELKRLGDPVKLQAMTLIKKALDPQGLMNPGKLFI